MTCKTVDIGGGNTAIICSRGERRQPCQFCGKLTNKLCDFPLRGKRVGQTCDKRICDGHATRVGPDRDLCPPHMRQIREAAIPAEVLADPNPAALLVALDGALEKGTAVQGAWANYADWEEFWKERSAIYEYLAGLPRAQADLWAQADAGPAPAKRKSK